MLAQETIGGRVKLQLKQNSSKVCNTQLFVDDPTLNTILVNGRPTVAIIEKVSDIKDYYTINAITPKGLVKKRINMKGKVKVEIKNEKIKVTKIRE